MRWRQARHVGVHIYEQRGAKPHDLDRPIATFLRPDDAALACEAVNDRTALAAVLLRVSEALGVLDAIKEQDPDAPFLDDIRTALTGATTRR